MTIENKEMGISFEVDNQQDFDKWYAIRKEQIRAEVTEEVIALIRSDGFKMRCIVSKEPFFEFVEHELAIKDRRW